MTPADIIKLAAEHGLAIDMTTPVFEALDIVFKLGRIVENKACADACEECGYDATGFSCAELIRMRCPS
jgi:hypothetical protein